MTQTPPAADATCLGRIVGGGALGNRIRAQQETEKRLAITCGKSKARTAPHLCSRLSCCRILQRGRRCLGQPDDWWQRESFEECDPDSPDSRLSFASEPHQSTENDSVVLTKRERARGRAEPAQPLAATNQQPAGLSLQRVCRRDQS